MNRSWKKVLYENQGVPDNYVDESFLSNLKTDANVHRYTFSEAVVASCRVTHELSYVALFLVAFYYLQQEEANSESSSGTFVVGCVCAFLVLIVIVFVGLIGPANSSWVRARDVAVFLLFGYGFSPLLKNLTETISTDTIYAMVFGMLLVHLLFQDYGASSGPVSGQFSLNAAIFGAVCLASRLTSTLRAFALLTLAAELFATAPVFHRWALTLRPSIQIVSAAVTAILAILVTSTVSPYFALLLVLSCAFLSGICPALFVNWQHQKENIHGPWDEAVVTTSEVPKHSL